MGRYLDEFVVGEKFKSAARTVTETDVVMFSCITGDMHQNHTDAAAMEHSVFGKRIAQGLLGISWAHGFLFRMGLIEEAIAFMESQEWKFVAPIFLGDTIHAEITIKDVIPSRSKPDRGILKLFFEMVDQNGRVCQTGTKCIMMKRKTKSEEEN